MRAYFLSLSLSLFCRAISRNGTLYDLSHSGFTCLYKARDRDRACVGGTKLDPRMHYLAHARARIRAQKRVYSCARRQGSYCPHTREHRVLVERGGWNDGGKRDRKRVRSKTRDRALSHSLSFFPSCTRGTRSFFTFKNHDDAHFSDS